MSDITISSDGKRVSIDNNNLLATFTKVGPPGADGEDGAASLPVLDSTAIVKGSVDDTKQVRIEADGITTGQTRVITMADNDVDLSDIAVNTAKVSYDDAAAVALNTAKISYTDAAAVSANTAKVTNATHSGDVSGSTTLTIGADKITLAMLKAAAKTESLLIALGDETTDMTTGTAKVTFRMPYAFTVTDVRASVTTAPTGSVATFDINEGGTTILSTKITIEAGEKTSTSAATPPVVSDSALADDAELTIDIDTIGSTVAGAGAKITLIGYQT